MQCPECAAEVSSLREFCPHCGTPIRRRFRRRSPEAPEERSEDELKRNRRRVLVIGAAIIFAMAVIGKGNWIDFDIDPEAPARPKGPVVVEVQELHEAYRRDADAADALYGGREIVVSGPFVRIAPDGQGDPDLRLATSDPSAPFGADLIRASHAQAPQLRPGQIVTVSCAHIARTGEERWLRNCAIQEVRDAPPPSAPPPALPSLSPPVAPVPPAVEGNGG